MHDHQEVERGSFDNLDRETSGVFFLTSLDGRLKALECNQQTLLPLIGKMESNFSTLVSDIQEIKGDVKINGVELGKVAIQLVGFDNRVKDLEAIRDAAKDHKKAVRTAVFGVIATVVGAALIYLFNFK
jgi:hypothetical protein